MNTNQLSLLSLKTLYQFLTVNDYPIYSSGIITRENHKGLTLARFWQNHILREFRNRKCGSRIWRSAGGRNRYISEICNRSDRLCLYGEYAGELCAAADGETVLRQIRQFMNMLAERKYSYLVFCHKLPVYLKLLAQEDLFFTKEAQLFFRDAWNKKDAFEKQGNAGRTFFCAWILTFLMFHALSGNGEGEVSLKRLRGNEALSADALGRLWFAQDEKPPQKVVYLTNKNTELCSAPLSRRHFFGRERELFELSEMLREGGKYVISGIGGIGKTELMRQLLRWCEQEALVDDICAIQYEGSLMSSFVNAFPQINGSNIEDNFREALARIRLCEGRRVLIVIDNMNCSDDEKLADLEALPATVFITSRYQELGGLTVYPVGITDKSSGALIFRDNYGKALTAGDKRILTDILRNDIWCHTLTLRFLGHIAAENGWTLPKLWEQLEAGAALADVDGYDSYESLRQLYRRMYAGFSLKKEMTGLLRIFSVLPYQSYSVSFAERFLRGYAAEGMAVRECLEELYRAGWLEKRGDSYSMHPFIGECVRADKIREKDAGAFFREVIAAWHKSGKGLTAETAAHVLSDWPAYQRACGAAVLDVMMLIPAVISKLTGRYGLKLFDLAMSAYAVSAIRSGRTKEALSELLRIKGNSVKLTEERRIVLDILLCRYGYSDLGEMEKEFRAQQKQPSVSGKVMAQFGYELANEYYSRGNLDRVEDLTELLLEYEPTDEEKMLVCLFRAAFALLKGDYLEAGERLRKGMEIGRSSGGGKGDIICDLMLELVSYYSGMRQFEKAEEILEEVSAAFVGGDNLHIQIQLCSARGILSMYRGDPGFGVGQLEEARSLVRALEGSPGGRSYAVAVTVLAMAYDRAGRREEASECYQEVLALYRNSRYDEPGVEFDRHRILNNMGTMYLDWGKPQEALRYLDEGYEIAQRLGGLDLAENANNHSRAWRMLGDREKELRYLREALPVLERTYGGEHPKVTDAKKRMDDNVQRDIERRTCE